LAQLAFDAPVDRRSAGTPAALSKGIPTTTSDPQELNKGTLNRWSYLALQSGMADDPKVSLSPGVQGGVSDCLSPEQERKRNSLQQF